MPKLCFEFISTLRRLTNVNNLIIMANCQAGFHYSFNTSGSVNREELGKSRLLLESVTHALDVCTETKTSKYKLYRELQYPSGAEQLHI